MDGTTPATNPHAAPEAGNSRVPQESDNFPEVRPAETLDRREQPPEFNGTSEPPIAIVEAAPFEKDIFTNVVNVQDIESQGILHRKWLRCPIWLLATVCLATVTLTAIGVGVGIPVGKKHNNTPDRIIGLSALDSGNITNRSITLFHGAVSGQIRKADATNGIWTADTDTVAAKLVKGNIRTGSPLTAVTYVQGDEKMWRVFYVDKANILQEVVSSNQSAGWSTGFLGAAGYAFSPSPHAGISVCTNSYYGNGLGLRLYFGSGEGNIQELIWQQGENTWKKGFTFPDSNGHGGFECTTRGLSTTYVWLLNSAGVLQQWWYDFNNSAASATHRTEEWVKGLTHSDVVGDSSIAAIQVNNTRLVHFQAPNNTIMELATKGEAENMTWSLPTYAIGKGLPGTRLTSVVLMTNSGGAEVRIIGHVGTICSYYSTDEIELS